jgi:sirohydrochlorin ferrochelatase
MQQDQAKTTWSANRTTKRYGVLVISHGSREENWVSLVDDAVRQVDLPDNVPVFSSFLEIVEGRLIQDGIDRLEEQGVTDIVVVPLFACSGSVHIDEIRYALGLTEQPALPTDLPLMRINARVHWTSVMDDHPIIVDVLWDRLMAISSDPRREVLVVIGHGSSEGGFYDRWRVVTERLAGKLRDKGGFAAAEAALLLPDETKETVDRLQDAYPDHDVLIVPFFISEGYFTRKVIPQRLEGKRYKYNGKTLLPHPGVTRWIEAQVREAIGETL